MPFAIINPTNPTTDPKNFQKKILRIGDFEKHDFFASAILNFFFKKKNLHLNENKQPVHMRYHLFLQYGWFLQNLGKYFIPTNMHTTVHLWSSDTFISLLYYLIYERKKPNMTTLVFIYYFIIIGQVGRVERGRVSVTASTRTASTEKSCFPSVFQKFREPICPM